MDLIKTSFAVAIALMPFALSVMIKMDFLYAFVGLVITMVISYNILRNWFDQYRISDIRGRYVLITGCDTGFGRALAERLVKKGVNTIAACLNEESVTEFEERNVSNIIPIRMDVSSRESIQQAYDTLITRHPQIKKGLWGIVNNAGILGFLAPSEWIKYEDYVDVFNVNVFGPILVTNKFLTFVKRANGRIINVASYLSRFSPPNNSQYAMSKHAIRSYSDTLRRELYPFDVSVHTLELGAHRTGLVDADLIVTRSQRLFHNLEPALKEEYGEQFLEETNEILRKSLPWLSSTRIESAVDAYEHALFGLYPRTRYRVGVDSRFFSFLALLPDWLPDLLFNLTGIKPRGVEPYTG